MQTSLVLLACGLSALPAAAQSRAALDAALYQMQGTTRVYSQPMVTSGALTGCTLVFDALHQDHAYSQGRFIKVSGNVGFMAVRGALGSTVKVVVSDLDTASMAQTPANPPPTRAYLMADNYVNNLASLVGASASDTPGAVFAIYQIEPALRMVMDGLESGKLTVAFNRGEGSTDILLPIEVDVSDIDRNGVRQRSPKASQDFLYCLEALATSVQK